MKTEKLTLFTYGPEYKECLNLISKLPKKYASILKSKKVSADLTEVEIKSIIALKDLDSKLDRVRKFLNNQTLLFLILTAFCIFGIFWGKNNIEGNAQVLVTRVGALITLVPALLFMLFFLQRRSIAQYNLPDRYTQLIAPLLSMFLEDLPKQKSCALSFDLSGVEKSPKAGEKKTISHSPKIVERRYTDRYFSLQQPLEKGWMIKCELIEILRKRVKTKRSASGKTKVKMKFKSYYYIDITLSTPSTYTIDDTPVNNTKVKVKRGPKRNTVRSITKTSRPTRESLPISEVMQALSSVFARVQRVAPPNA